MSQYTSEFPPGDKFDSAYKSFFEEFYKISDTAGSQESHEAYIDQFTEDATLIMASKTCKGRYEILKLREGMWEKVASRSHKPLKMFPFGPSSDEVMLFGTVEYGMKDGGSAGKDWAARAKLVKEGDRVRMSFYQVYLDMAPQAPSK